MDVKTTLSTRPDGRTPEMIKQVMLGLQTLQSLGEYPLDTQEQLCRVAWFQHTDKKLNAKQNFKSANFFYSLQSISSSNKTKAVVKKIEPDPATGEEHTRVVARLNRGQSFGELGLIFKTPRNATVESGTAMELLVVGKEDFLKIFMHNVRPGEDPDHIAFLKQQPVLRYWPFEVLREDPSACLINYFKRGTLVTENGKASEWIYFIKSGSCEAVKRLKSVTPRTEKDLRRQLRKQVKDIQLPDISSKLELTRSNPKHPLHPEIFRSMTDFFDDIRMKSEDELRAARKRRSSSLGSVRTRKTTSTTPEVLEGLSKPSRKHSQWEITGPALTVPIKQVYFKRTPPAEDIPLPPIPPRIATGPGVSRSKFLKLSKLLNKSHLQVPTLASISTMYGETEPNDHEEEKESARDDREDVFVTVEKLQARDIFKPSSYIMTSSNAITELKLYDSQGMNTISFDDEKATDIQVPEVALVSRGAEIVMLSKRTYLKYADERDKLAVQELITPYPGEEQLQENLQVQANWDVYRQRVLEDVMYLNYAYKRTFSGIV
ncbi:cyclic nucleotide-binding domain-containing protein 2-like [Plakobranchus ocellatus]|uniref:Cyclic nucleotide-binding domain-containing protein 2-like n=1 Tax=Plakobranchus ocellatus TaxID=259542 RepID=A0AAV3Y4I0_9GAST|nr:cyclic nucleotide-binding domain-containing protein 2-like [Plakobranchus ocellatus]